MNLDDLEYGDVEIVNGEEQWNEFSKSRWQQDESDSQENVTQLKIYADGKFCARNTVPGLDTLLFVKREKINMRL